MTHIDPNTDYNHESHTFSQSGPVGASPGNYFVRSIGNKIVPLPAPKPILRMGLAARDQALVGAMLTQKTGKLRFNLNCPLAKRRFCEMG